jgi:sulfoxide reductase catalytic subunit YedY
MSRLPKEPPAAEITPEAAYLRRRDFLKNSALFAGTAAAVGAGLLRLAGGPGRRRATAVAEPASSAVAPPGSLYTLDEPRTSYDSITTYNNFYELGLRKGDPAENAGKLRVRPWVVAVEGEVKKPELYDLDTLLAWFTPEERVYRMRCVETWSMVIPWLGIPLGDLIRRLEPTSRAKYVSFVTLRDKTQLPGQEADVLPWPYLEALRIDEAVHSLSMLAIGLYGKPLPGQNGAPLRLVVPWKYGFKGGKSIVKIRFTEERPATTWNRAAPEEYGFYANVNPAVAHPRWSQEMERRIGDLSRRPTLPFNGYAEQVASLYAGMDLQRDF